jgi:hypothetical protein
VERAPRRLHARLFDAFDIQALYNRADNQVTISAALTAATLDTIAAIMAGDADLAGRLGMSHLASDPLTPVMPHP